MKRTEAAEGAPIRSLAEPQPHVLVVRLDSEGDVLLMGPAIRAVSAGARRVTLLCGPRGRAAARLLPGVDEVIVHRAAWIDPEPDPVTRGAMETLVDELASLGADHAIVFTSFHQSALPLALLLRMAGIPTIAAISDDYPGSLLDVRHHAADDLHEVERALDLVATLGYALPGDDDGALAITRSVDRELVPEEHRPYVVVHPGASVPARAWPAEKNRALVGALAASGTNVVVTGGPNETALAARVASGHGASVLDLAGRTDLDALATVLADADAIVAGNTGPAHLAAAVGTPVVSLFAPTVPAVRWRPWKVPHVLLGVQDIACAGCRAKVCPFEGHPCLGAVEVSDVLRALDELLVWAASQRPPAPHDMGAGGAS